MTQAERDRLVALKKAKKGLTQAEVAKELGISERQVRRMLKRLRKQGDRSVIHGLKGKASNRKLEEKIRERAVEALSAEECGDFGPTYARDYLAAKKKIEVSRETVRFWMTAAGLWKAGRKREKKQHVWRERRSRLGELVQWDTSDHDWLEGRCGQRLYLIAMIDDATSRLWARFAPHDSTEENLKLLESYLLKHGRPGAFYTDKASLFRTALKTARDEKALPRDEREPPPPTQIGRALRELDIVWLAAHSPQAKGRIERSFETAQDRLVKDLRIAGARTLEEANRILESDFIPWWNRTLAVEARGPDDAHRALEQQHDLAAILSHVEQRIVGTDYTVQFEGKRYGIERSDIRTGLRGAAVRVEKRRDGTIAIRFGEHYLRHRVCVAARKAQVAEKSVPVATAQKARRAAGGSWMKNFRLKSSPSLDKAIAISNATA